LLALGFGSQGVKRRVANGRLHPVRPGVYAVGRPELTAEGRWMAALLHCGRGAVLSHSSAARLFLIENERPGLIEITVPASRNPRGASDIRVFRRELAISEVTSRHGIPSTAPARTLLDLANRLSSRRLEAAINAADKHDLVSPPELRAYAAACSGRCGAPALRKLLDRDTFTLTDSELERLFIPLAARAGLPPPMTGAVLNGFKVDFHWPQLGLVVETDGLRYHRTASQQARDRMRDQAHAAAGLTTLRFTHSQVRHHPARVRDTLARVADRLGS
jgi:hypothetical protein